MLETYFGAPKTLERLRAGPSGPYMDGFAASLIRDGYRAATAVRYLRAAAHLGHFLQGRGGTLANIDLSAFFQHLRTCRSTVEEGKAQPPHLVRRQALSRLPGANRCLSMQRDAGDSECRPGTRRRLPTVVAEASRCRRTYRQTVFPWCNRVASGTRR